MISISPLLGFKYLTPFTISISPSSTDSLVNWGDGTFSDTSTATHIFSAANLYNIYAGNCSSTSAFYVSVYNGPFFENKINITYDSISAFASCPNTFDVQVSAVVPSATVFLYSSGSNSYPYSNNSFWSHLNPAWKFSMDDSPISELSMELSPVVSGGFLLGYAATSTIQYSDDMPGNPNLFFTLKQEEGNNSRIYSSIQTNISADTPAELVITSDGINPIASTQFGDISIPHIISIKGVNGCGNIMHYASGTIINSSVLQGCNGIGTRNYTFSVSTINLTDGCFNTGGYIQSFLNVPLSAIPSNIIESQFALDSCGQPTPELEEFSEVQKNPFSVSISAIANVVVNNQTYQISGVSNNFNVYRLYKFHDFYRKGEDKTVYDIIKKYSHFDLDANPVFDSYLSAIAGEGDTLGKVYDKIVNFNKDMSDVDLCTIDALTNMGTMLDNEIDDFSLAYPEELRRLMNMFSIPVNKLIGTRCVCNTNFAACGNCVGSNNCGFCGYDKKSNVGKILGLDDIVTGNSTILKRENGSEIYDFYLVESTTKVRNISALDLNKYCVYEWNDEHQNNPVESVIDYKNPNTTVSRSLSSARDWVDDEGIMETVIQRVLTYNLVK